MRRLEALEGTNIIEVCGETSIGGLTLSVWLDESDGSLVIKWDPDDGPTLTTRFRPESWAMIINAEMVIMIRSSALRRVEPDSARLDADMYLVILSNDWRRVVVGKGSHSYRNFQ